MNSFWKDRENSILSLFKLVETHTHTQRDIVAPQWNILNHGRVGPKANNITSALNHYLPPPWPLITLSISFLSIVPYYQTLYNLTQWTVSSVLNPSISFSSLTYLTHMKFNFLNVCIDSQLYIRSSKYPRTLILLMKMIGKYKRKGKAFHKVLSNSFTGKLIKK